ncbi:MAG: hypothetical protein O9274_01020 [Limnobacter sp.]|uniref:hypothetical protein n=1 Tax=Limnobacter sp. TaxID=2003368 RepID=UPI0022BFAC80|nr:hypothetical protein [Limnobacter sp.]MCZ8014257.1 hypothetical protein [Limnobacter sp.]
MSDFAIHLSVSTQPEQAAVGVFELDHAATIEFFDRSEPSFGGNRIQLTYLDGINNQDSGSERLGDLLCVSNLCVSDPGVFESITSIASVDPGLLAYSQPTPVMDNMNIESSLHALKSELLGSMPKLQLAMNGELAYDELSQLIQDIQAQVLDLNSINQDLFGDLSTDVNSAVASLETLESYSLLDSMQIDIGEFSDYEFSGLGNSLALEATLDGLFTSPEAFPLTLDFSNPNGIQEVSELFASASGAGTSISSTALATDVDTSFPGSTPGSTDYS